MERQYAEFNTLPRELSELDMDIGGQRVMAYFDEEYTGPVVVITGNELVAVMPSVEEGLKLARYAISPEGNKREIEIIPAESIHTSEYSSFEKWLEQTH